MDRNGSACNKLFLLVVCIFHHLKNRISFNICKCIRYNCVGEIYIKKKSCHVLAAGAPFPHAVSAVLTGQQELPDGLWLPPSYLASLKAHSVPRGATGPASPGSRAMACALWAWFLHGPEVQPWLPACGLLHPVDTGTANICDVPRKNHTHF